MGKKILPLLLGLALLLGACGEAPEEPSRNEMRAEALRMAREGMDVGEIAAALGYSKGEVSFMLKLGPQDMQYGKK